MRWECAAKAAASRTRREPSRGIAGGWVRQWFRGKAYALPAIMDFLEAPRRSVGKVNIPSGLGTRR